MGAEPIKYDIRTTAIVIMGVAALELAARAVDFDPLAVTGGVRVLDGIIIVGVSFRFSSRVQIAGLIPPDLLCGVRKGIVWSACFGLFAVIGALGCLAAGIDPLKLIRVRLPSDPLRVVLFFLVGGVIGPIAEELFFRGVIYGFLRKWGVWIALPGSTALFVFAHGLGGVGLPQLLGGLVFAAAYEYEKNLLVPIIIHVTGNIALFSIGLF